MKDFEILPDYSPNIRINSYDIPLFGEFCLSNLLEPAALCCHDHGQPKSNPCIAKYLLPSRLAMRVGL